MIVDALTHVTPDGRWFQSSFDAGESHLLSEMETAGVERAVVVALAGFISNEYVLEVCQRQSGRLIPGASFNPAAYDTPLQAVHEFRAQLHRTPFRVLKLHPRLNRYDPLDTRCLSVLEELSSWEHPMKVWLDSLFYFRGGNLGKPVVDTIHEVVNRFPSLTFVLLHGGGSWVLHVAEAIRDCPNAFLDISFILDRYAESSLWSDLRYLVSDFDRRMVFGSDFPEISIGSALRHFERLMDGLPAEKRTNVLERTLTTILDIDHNLDVPGRPTRTDCPV